MAARAVKAIRREGDVMIGKKDPSVHISCASSLPRRNHPRRLPSPVSRLGMVSDVKLDEALTEYDPAVAREEAERLLRETRNETNALLRKHRRLKYKEMRTARSRVIRGKQMTDNLWGTQFAVDRTLAVISPTPPEDDVYSAAVSLIGITNSSCVSCPGDLVASDVISALDDAPNLTGTDINVILIESEVDEMLAQLQ